MLPLPVPLPITAASREISPETRIGRGALFDPRQEGRAPLDAAQGPLIYSRRGEREQQVEALTSVPGCSVLGCSSHILRSEMCELHLPAAGAPKQQQG